MRQPDTALRSYHDASQQPRRKTQSQQILDFLEQSGRAMTLGEIAKAIGVPDSTASARLNAMRPEKLDVYHERRCTVSGNVRQTWFFTKPQRALFGGSR